MPTVKHALLSFAVTAVGVAIIFRVPAIRKAVTGLA
jgi:hypothetical protein